MAQNRPPFALPSSIIPSISHSYPIHIPFSMGYEGVNR